MQIIFNFEYEFGQWAAVRKSNEALQITYPWVMSDRKTKCKNSKDITSTGNPKNMSFKVRLHCHWDGV